MPFLNPGTGSGAENRRKPEAAGTDPAKNSKLPGQDLNTGETREDNKKVSDRQKLSETPMNEMARSGNIKGDAR